MQKKAQCVLSDSSQISMKAVVRMVAFNWGNKKMILLLLLLKANHKTRKH